MLRNVSARFLTASVLVHRDVRTTPSIRAALSAFNSVRNYTDEKDEALQAFDTSLLKFLVCPLSKKPLRFEAKTNELINDELGIAYSISDGIPNMIPQEARLIKKESNSPAQE
ncbi:protein preY, mitochondrial-like [Corythoichthys intestinalis]|uniref:protein preY, mitochondrial-like n=1 Tax=Corythoichthys intestinalis TaxID=161448 RepID=UPI0025A62978|nr:protein preY, mitochondrial-like [Corythoichthys intestinalis]